MPVFLLQKQSRPHTAAFSLVLHTDAMDLALNLSADVYPGLEKPSKQELSLSPKISHCPSIPPESPLQYQDAFRCTVHKRVKQYQHSPGMI